MVPAHHIVELKLIGCPDPNPVNRRFFNPQESTLNQLDEIGDKYIQSLSNVCRSWLNAQDPKEPIGVMFSGGIDSGSVFLVLYDAMLKLGMSPSRLKAFTLSIDGRGDDASQSFDFLKPLGLELFLEVIETAPMRLILRKRSRSSRTTNPSMFKRLLWEWLYAKEFVSDIQIGNSWSMEMVEMKT